jgi:NADH:quinone reductase (non-electrogenic)
VCIDEKVPVETAAYKPDSLAPAIKQGGARWIHKAARVKDAVHVEELGPDAIILVGLEGAGIKNPELLPTMTTIIWGRRRLNVPIIVAGGIGDARGFLAAFDMGADGIMMGSAFLASRECWIADSMKEAIIALNQERADSSISFPCL